MRFFSRTRAMLSHTWGAFRADVGMGIVGSPSPDADYWYGGTGHRSAAGPNVTPGSATRLAAVFACTRVCAETLSSLPVGIYRERKSGGRDAATDHPAQELFLEPNPWQTGMEFFEMMQGHLELRGNAYALKVPGGGRAIDQLIPLHPDRVRVYLLPNQRLRYEVTAYSTGHIDRYTQDEILHLRAWSFDGIMGISTVSAMAEVIGVGLAQQEFRARSFHRPFPGMTIETMKLTPEAEETLRKSLAEGLSGDHAFNAMVLPPGMKATALSLTNKDQQLIEASNASRIEVCGAWRVPPHKIGDLSRGTFSNIEQQNIEFATDCMRPRIVRVERRMDRDIVNALRAYESASGDYFMTLNMDALYRGDMKSRYEAYAQGIAAGWLMRNESRRAEGLNPIDGLDAPLVAVNMETVDQAQQRSDNAAATADAASADANSQIDEGGGGAETPEQTGPEEDEQKAQLVKMQLRALAIASAAAGRVVRREVKALRKIGSREFSSIEGQHWISETRELYAFLPKLIAETMAISVEAARPYAAKHEEKMLNCHRNNLFDWTIDGIEEDGPAQLAELALGAKCVTA